MRKQAGIFLLCLVSTVHSAQAMSCEQLKRLSNQYYALMQQANDDPQLGYTYKMHPRYCQLKMKMLNVARRAAGQDDLNTQCGNVWFDYELNASAKAIQEGADTIRELCSR